MTVQLSHAGKPLSTPTFNGRPPKTGLAENVVALGDTPKRIAAYYSLRAASFENSQLPAQMSKRLPHYPVPAAVLGRLAVDRAHQARGLGELSLLDAIRRVVRASETIAAYAIVVDPKTDRAKDFYESHGFIAFAGARRRLYLPFKTSNAPRHDDLLA